MRFFATLWAIACQAPLSVGFSRQEYWNELPFPPPRDLLNPGIEPMSPAYWQAGSLPLSHLEIACVTSVQFSRSVMSDSLWPYGLQHARLPCPLPTPGAYSNSCPASWWCHPTISSSVVPFSFCLQSFPASRSFPVRQFFASGGQRIGVSASPSVLPMNVQGGFPLGLTGWISLQSKGTLKSLLQHHISKASILWRSTCFIVWAQIWANTHIISCNSPYSYII